jgi:hypothetical protein
MADGSSSVPNVNDANKVTIYDANGALSSETTLSHSRGGLGQNVSDLATLSNTGKFIQWDNTAGIFVMAESIPSGSISDAQVNSSAAI